MYNLKKIESYIKRKYHDAILVEDKININYEHIIIANSNDKFNGLVIIMEDVPNCDEMINYDLRFNTFTIIAIDKQTLRESIDKYILDGINEHVASRYDILMDKSVFVSNLKCDDPDCIYCKKLYHPLKNIFI